MSGEKSKTKGPEVVMEYDSGEEEIIEEKPKKIATKPKKSQTAKKGSVKKVVCDDEKPSKKKKKSSKKKVKSSTKTKKKSSKSKDTPEEQELKKKIEAPVDKTIQALIDSDRTFVENITRDAKKSIFSSFYPFPKNTRLPSTEKDEVVVLVVRHHWSGLLPRLILALFTMLLPSLLVTATDIWFDSAFSVILFNTGMFIFFAMLAFSIVLDGFFKWFYQVNIITSSRIIDVDFVSIMTHRISETTFDQVQDVSHSPGGPLASFFNYGDVYIQTAGSQSEFHFINIPRPRDVQDTIFDLRYLRKKYFIDMHGK